ncbi:MAG: hypothetical protein AB7E76_07450 [Deferribacterales bacterium]
MYHSQSHDRRTGSLPLFNAGTGIWAGFSFRLFVPPEIKQIILRREE